MEHILSAALAIVLGVGCLVAYFYGSNRLLDWLLPNYDDEKQLPDDTTPVGIFGKYSFPDLLVVILGIILIISFYVLPWLSLKTDHGTINLRGDQLSAIEADKLEDLEDEQLVSILSDALGLDDEAILMLMDEEVVEDFTKISQNIKLINSFYHLVIIGSIAVGLWGVFDKFRRRAAALVAVHVGLAGLLYYLFLSFRLGEQGYSYWDIAGFGNWLALIAVLGLFVQAFLPRSPITDYNRSIQLREGARPWLFVGPALLILTIYLVYPVIQTAILSFYNADGNRFVGLDNYQWALGDSVFLQSIRNNIMWLLVVPLASTTFGLIIAVLADRVRWGTIAKSFIFLPMAISFIGASVIWLFVYDFSDIGLLNAIVTFFGGEPQAWVALKGWNSFLLMIILIWIQTGFAMVLMSAALRGVPEETIEASRIDGAGEVRIFFNIMIPQIMGTIAVVMTTITIVVLKVFDIVLAMTNGQHDTQVLANMMYDWMFRGGGDFGRGSMLAMIIMVAVIPIMAWNIRRFQQEEAMR